MQTPPSGPLLSLRATLVLLIAVLVGIGAGVLTSMAGQPLPAAVLAGCTAAGGAAALSSTLIG